MRIYILIIISVYVAKLSAQGGFKTRYYYPQALSNDARAIFETSPGNYIGCGFVYDTTGGLSANRLLMMGLDSQGQVLWTKKYGNKTPEYLQNNFIRRSFYKQGNFIYWAGCARDTNNRQIGVFTKFDLNGDTLWQKIYRDADSLQDVLPQMVTGSVDGGFLMTGFFQHWGLHATRCLLIKTDASGNELWRKKIGSNTQDGKAIVQDSASKKIVIAGYRYIGGPNIYDNILVLDSLGEQLSQNTYINSGGNVLDLIQTRDKKIVVIGCQYSNQTMGGNPLMHAYVGKFDLHNPLVPIWEVDDFDKLTLKNAFACLKELPNGDILVGGWLDTMLINIMPDNVLNRLTIFDTDGNLKWNRYYDYKTNTPDNFNYIASTSLELCSDGGWIAALQITNFPNPNPFFFVKYDSTGCDSTEVYCAATYTLGLNSLNRHESFRIFPNPVKDVLSIETGIPQDIDIHVYDVSGREVKRVKLNTGEKIHVSDLSKGIYLITISRDREVIYKTKIIKE